MTPGGWLPLFLLFVCKKCLVKGRHGCDLMPMLISYPLLPCWLGDPLLGDRVLGAHQVCPPRLPSVMQSGQARMAPG